MPLTARSSAQRRRKKADEKLPERAGESTASEVMAPTRMKLRVRRRDNAAAAAARGGGPLEEEEEPRREISSRRKNASKTPPAASSSAAHSSSASASVRAVMAAEDASPDSKCPICLDRFNNLAYLDRCLHRFCFPCIQEWSHNKAECPLCKQPFASILHSVRAENDFKEYTLHSAPANSRVAATVAMVAAMAARSDHQMRLMLRTQGGDALTRRRRRERAGRGDGGRAAGMWQWYLDSPPLPLPPLPHHAAVSPLVTEDSEDEDDAEQQSADPSERGVIFETSLEGAAAPVAPTDRAARRLMARLVARQRQQREGGAVRRLREREAVAFRRTLYRCGIRVRGVAGVDGDPGQQPRDITADSFCRSPALLNRLRPWLRRELTVLYGAHSSLVDIAHRIIMARLTRHGLEEASTIEGELRQFLLARTEHFVHELVSFARSPLSMDAYDQQAVYEPPAAAMELDGVSSSSDSSSVIAISEGEEEELRAGGAEQRAGADDVIQTGSCLSLSGWDDETPGPSYSTADQVCSLAPLSFSPAPQEAANEERGEKGEEEAEEECLIVGYKKPIAERTPELVQLSSDTEEEKEAAEKSSPRPSTAAAILPTIPPSTSGSFREEQEDQQDVAKDGGAAPRARSWSGSSGRSGGSVCLLSPPTPRRDGGRKRCGSEPGEKRRRKRRRRSSERLRRSGVLHNPNRSLYPAAMMLRRSSSPFQSSSGSASPEPPSPPDSSWDFHQVSPLTSSVSSPSHASSSSRLSSSPPPSSLPPQTPPTPSLSPSCRTHHGEKPGGKRKYKSRHLDSDKDPTWRPREGRGERRRKGGGGGRRRRDGGESRRSRLDRSPSVEIIYEGTVSSPAHKRRRRHRKTQLSSSPVIITLDSDIEDATRLSGSSSPISSQQTVDFNDLPPLPLVHSAGMGGALDADIGELPVDILDRESDGCETEPAGPSSTAAAMDAIAVDNSDAEVDVENGDEAPPPPQAADRQPIGEADAAEQCDRALLAALLADLKAICPPKPARQDQQAQGAGSEGAEPEAGAPPPLIKHASPTGSHIRTTPPPLKHGAAQLTSAPPLTDHVTSCSQATPTLTDHVTSCSETKHYTHTGVQPRPPRHVDQNHSHSSSDPGPPLPGPPHPGPPHPGPPHPGSSSGGSRAESAPSSPAAVFSGVTSNHMSPPPGPRTQDPPSPTDPPSSGAPPPPPAEGLLNHTALCPPPEQHTPNCITSLTQSKPNCELHPRPPTDLHTAPPQSDSWSTDTHSSV